LDSLPTFARECVFEFQQAARRAVVVFDRSVLELDARAIGTLLEFAEFLFAQQPVNNEAERWLFRPRPV